MTRATARLSRFGACALGCFAFDVDDALDVVLLPLTSDRHAVLLCLAFGAALAFVCRSAFGASTEPPSRVRRRAYGLVSLAMLPWALAAHASAVTALGVVLAACALVELTRLVKPVLALILATVLPLTLAGSVFVAALLDLPIARAAVIRRVKAESIIRGTTRCVPGWGFVDVSHIHPGIFHVARAQLESSSQPIRVQTEIIDLRGEIHVIERTYRLRASPAPRWAIACAIALDIGLEAERAQANTPWWMGFAPSAYQFDDMPSNVLGCLGAANRVSPRRHTLDTAGTLERFRTDASALSRQREPRYVLPVGATSEEREAFAQIEAANDVLDASPVRMYRFTQPR